MACPPRATRSSGRSAPRPGFSFVVKAFRLFTLHHTAPEALPKDIRAALGPLTKKNLYYADLPAELAIELWSRFRSALAPLQRANKLAGVLFQFPPWFMRSRANYEHIVRCKEVLAGARDLRRISQPDLVRRSDIATTCSSSNASMS